ncbi:MgtC/SapB family protein [Romeria aff. gracilis LEGE 07310]|uniref:MgtC/SapB family protein n=1 Tax=Vasconcelosia minhoensis LEGE 07310 TaxID=915328 RepID=A0A8J7A4T1_9CYAN|nr:MgtC/SapB family protein [Romeria gracilis]MBE9076307.1 MgtC/SapB family protein [Romeria aff. gracilis LEGE 07310]
MVNPGELDLLGRLALALAAGAVIGWNREAEGKAAGLRTYMLTTLGSAFFVLIPLQFEELDLNALSRTIQGVATGVGFLGAGEIVYQSREDSRSKPLVKGLTSAAAIWSAAALGVAAGCGLWQLCLLGTFLVWLILSLGKWAEHRIWR